MKRSDAIRVLASSKRELARRFGVERLALFGSTARDTARDASDVDVLVTFAGPATSKNFFGVKFFLEEALGCTVDLVTDKAVRRELREFIEREILYV